VIVLTSFTDDALHAVVKCLRVWVNHLNELKFYLTSQQKPVLVYHQMCDSAIKCWLSRNEEPHQYRLQEWRRQYWTQRHNAWWPTYYARYFYHMSQIVSKIIVTFLRVNIFIWNLQYVSYTYCTVTCAKSIKVEWSLTIL